MNVSIHTLHVRSLAVNCVQVPPAIAPLPRHVPGKAAPKAARKAAPKATVFPAKAARTVPKFGVIRPTPKAPTKAPPSVFQLLRAVPEPAAEVLNKAVTKAVAATAVSKVASQQVAKACAKAPREELT